MDTASTPAVLLLNLPPSALGGIDLLSFTTTPKFQGIKNLPSGLHFIFIGSTSTLSVRHGVWINVTRTQPPDLFIRKWNTDTETLIPEPDTAAQLQQRANLGRLWRENLTPYRQTASDNTTVEDSNHWVQLADNITPALLSRILSSNPELWTLTSGSSAKADLDEIPGLSVPDALVDHELHLLPIDLKQTWREGATGRERTLAAQDRTWLFKSLCTSNFPTEPRQLLGELQFCFLMVLTLNNYSCFEQWRRLLTLLFTCKEQVSIDPDFFTQVIATLKLQLQHAQDVETGLFDLTDDGAGFLKTLLLRFRKDIEELQGNAHQDVLDELDDLLAYAEEKLAWVVEKGGTFARQGLVRLEDGEEVEMESHVWDEDDEAGEYAPMVVDLSDEQRQLLGLEVKQVVHGNKTPNLRDRLKGEDDATGVYADEVQSDDDDDEDKNERDALDESEEEMTLEDMDARY